MTAAALLLLAAATLVPSANAMVVWTWGQCNIGDADCIVCATFDDENVRDTRPYVGTNPPYVLLEISGNGPGDDGRLVKGTWELGANAAC